MIKFIKKLFSKDDKNGCPLSDEKLSSLFKYSFGPIHYDWRYLTTAEKKFITQNDLNNIKSFVDNNLK